MFAEGCTRTYKCCIFNQVPFKTKGDFHFPAVFIRNKKDVCRIVHSLFFLFLFGCKIFVNGNTNIALSVKGFNSSIELTE